VEEMQMGINIYKILRKEEMINDLVNQHYFFTNRSINDKLSLDFYYKSSYENEINWKNVFEYFGLQIDFRTKDIKGVILITKETYNYAITFGNTAFIAQKYCDVDFGFELARKIELKELKRKSTSAQRTRGRRGEVNTYTNEDKLDVDSGRIFTSLSFTPVDESLGKRIDFGKSIKLNIGFNLNEIESIIDRIESISASDVIWNNIPYLNKVKDIELINEYNNILFRDLEGKYSNSLNPADLDISLNEISVIGSSIYFDQDSSMAVKYNRIVKNINALDLSEVFQFIKDNQISLSDFILKGKIVFYGDDGIQLFTESIYNFISYDIQEKKVSLYEGVWNEYNSDFISLVQKSVQKIETHYDKQFDNMDTLCITLNGAYKEEKIINYLCKILKAESIVNRQVKVSHLDNKSSFNFEPPSYFVKLPCVCVTHHSYLV
jgi:uncharacterized protein (TIGR04141 family)